MVHTFRVAAYSWVTLVGFSIALPAWAHRRTRAPSVPGRLRVRAELAWAVALGGVSGCSSTSTGTLSLVTGGETDTFTAAPLAVRLDIQSIDGSGSVKTLASVPLPATSIDLGSFDRSSQATIGVAGFDATGATVIAGRSLPFQAGVADGATLPIFVQRSGAMARLPSFGADTRAMPLMTALGGRYLVVSGGEDATQAAQSRIFDFVGLAPLANAPALGLSPTSVASIGTTAWLFDATGSAVVFDFGANTSTPFMAPTGSASLADIAGGATVTATDGSQYVVGGTRIMGAASSAILKIDGATGAATWITLSAPRLGAAAAWIEGKGVVVAGGSATAPGLEVAGGGALGAFDADPTTGAGLASLDASHRLVMAGGTLPDGSDPGVRVWDLSCTDACVAEKWPALTTVVTSAQVFDIDNAHAVVVGNEPSSALTHAFAVTSGRVSEIATKGVHHGARAVASPIGAKGSFILYGGALDLESFEP